MIVVLIARNEANLKGNSFATAVKAGKKRIFPGIPYFC